MSNAFEMCMLCHHRLSKARDYTNLNASQFIACIIHYELYHAYYNKISAHSDGIMTSIKRIPPIQWILTMAWFQFDWKMNKYLLWNCMSVFGFVVVVKFQPLFKLKSPAWRQELTKWNISSLCSNQVFTEVCQYTN